MASEAEYRPRAVAKGGSFVAVNQPSSPSPSRPDPSDPGAAAEAAVQRAWALLGGSGNDDDNAGRNAEGADGSAARPSLFSDAESDGTADGGVWSPSSSSRAPPSRVASPPYWTNPHGRTASSVSAESMPPLGAIMLQDNENDNSDYDGGGPGVSRRDRSRACWAKSVRVDDFVVVNSSATNIGAFVVWNIKVETLNGSYMNIRKRYSEFVDFREGLIETFPGFEAAVPELPPKSVISKFRPRFLEQRRSGLQYFLNCILLNPEFSGSPVLKEFLFS